MSVEKAWEEFWYQNLEDGTTEGVNKRSFYAGFLISESRAQKLVENGNQLSSALSGLMECEEIECRGDEDCDHCYGVIANQEWDEALAQYKGEK